jgi:hypothetical protein
MLNKSLIVGAFLTAGMVSAANAQQAYPAYYPYYQAQRTPPSWSYDPYTSGLGPCPQRFPSDPPCRYTMSPTYGQPNFWQSY